MIVFACAFVQFVWYSKTQRDIIQRSGTVCQRLVSLHLALNIDTLYLDDFQFSSVGLPFLCVFFWQRELQMCLPSLLHNLLSRLFQTLLFDVCVVHISEQKRERVFFSFIQIRFAIQRYAIFSFHTFALREVSTIHLTLTHYIDLRSMDCYY